AAILHQLRQLPALMAALVAGRDLLQRGLELAADAAQPQRVAGAMDAPVVGIVVDVGDVLGARRAEREPGRQPQLAQPTGRGHGARELPLGLDLVFHAPYMTMLRIASPWCSRSKAVLISASGMRRVTSSSSLIRPAR